MLIRSLIGLSILLLAASQAFSQKTGSAISSQIRSLKAEKTIEYTFDSGSGSAKVMARADNFDAKEASKAGIQAIDFGMAFVFAGPDLEQTPETINLTFWILTKKPQFAASNSLIVSLAGETLDLGDARYAAKPGEQMEYLNFKIKRDDLAKIANASSVKFRLGPSDFTFTPGHLAILRNMIAISDAKPK